MLSDVFKGNMRKKGGKVNGKSMGGKNVLVCEKKNENLIHLYKTMLEMMYF